MRTNSPQIGSIFRTGKLEGVLLAAILCLVLASGSFAQSAEDYRQRAVELSRTKAWDEAIANYQKALELEPNDSLTHYNLALAWKYKGAPQQAVEEFEAALRLKPRWADAQYG